jgi:hypothetical protein
MNKNSDIEELLERWKEAKDEIADLENKCDKYKRAVEKIMNSEDTNKLSAKNICVTRRILNRESLSKKDIPKDIWEKYSKKLSYSAFYFSKKKC